MAKISILVPVYSSSQILPILLKSIEEERLKNNWDLELILVEDGSPDNSFEVIEELKKQYNYIKGIKLSRNFGQQATLVTGLSHVTGDYLAIIDDDLQDPPALLQNFFEQLDAGYDVVFGVRQNRKEGIFKILLYKSFYRVMRVLCSLPIPLDSGDFCVMNKKVVNSLLKLKERNPYLRGLRYWVGFKQLGMPYDRPSREHGETGMTPMKLMKFAMDGIFSFSYIPLKLALFLGGITFFGSMVYSVFIIYAYIFEQVPVKGFTTTILFVSIFGSVNMIFMGILGEYVARTYNESKSRPHAIIDRII